MFDGKVYLTRGEYESRHRDIMARIDAIDARIVSQRDLLDALMSRLETQFGVRIQSIDKRLEEMDKSLNSITVSTWQWLGGIFLSFVFGGGLTEVLHLLGAIH